MLAEQLKTAVSARGKIPQPDRQPGLSCSGLFPCPYRLYLVHTGKMWEEDELTGPDIMNMEDGWDQEEQSVRRLKEELGVIIKNRQAKVTIGRSNIPGSIDGEVDLNETYLWEHKAWATSRYEWFVSRGIEVYPGEKAQANAYMLGRGLSKCEFFVKKKEANDYHSIIVPLDKSYILPIIEWADRIRLDSWIPQPELTRFCAHCGVNCFGMVLDLSWVKDAKAPEMAEKWLTGDKYVKVGEMLMSEARTFFTGQVKIKDKWVKELPGLIGDAPVLLVEGLKIQKIVQHRFDVKKEDVFRVFGSEGLMKVGRFNDVVQYKIMEA